MTIKGYFFASLSSLLLQPHNISTGGSLSTLRIGYLYFLIHLAYSVAITIHQMLDVSLFNLFL